MPVLFKVYQESNDKPETIMLELENEASETPDIFIYGEPTKITYSQVEEIKKGMTYSEIINIL